MIRFKLTAANGRQLVGIGLEGGNIEKLINHDPILIPKETLKINTDIFIFYGATKAELFDALRENGFNMDDPMLVDAMTAYEESEKKKTKV